jgi:hypothetical protein
VASGGILGRPLEGVTVDIELARNPDEAPAHQTTRTDQTGRFHVCLPKDDRGPLEPLTTGSSASQYADRSAKVKVTFTRSGFRAETIERDLSTAKPDASLDVVLETDVQK